MPYKKTATAIAHYLILFRKIAEKYGNPFIVAYLPEPVVVDGRAYSRDTIKRYLSWVKRYYREKGREPPIRVEYVRDSKRGRVSAIHVDVARVVDEINLLSLDETPWPYRGGRRDAEIERLKSRIKRLEEKLARCRAEVEQCKAEMSRERGCWMEAAALKREADELRRRLEDLSERRNKAVTILRNLVNITPDYLIRCVDLKIEEPECEIARIILDRAITYKDDVTALDIVMSEVGDEYEEEIRRVARKALEQVERL